MMGDIRSPEDLPQESAKYAEHLMIIKPQALQHLNGIDEFEKEFPEIRLTVWDHAQGDAPKELLKTVTILCSVSSMPSPEDVPNLKLVHLLSAGFDKWVNHPIFKDTDIPITNVSGIHGPPISEWVIMNWLVHSREYNRIYELQKKREWRNSGFSHIQDHVAKKVGIVGYGSIGRQIARVSAAMGMEVYAYTFSPRETPESKKDKGYIIPHTGDPDGSIPKAWYSGAEREHLHDFLALGLDHVVVSVPLTDSTKQMFSTEEFAAMSEGSKSCQGKPFFTNISRGAVVDQDALIHSLKAGELSGAAIDVAVPEPLPADHPLWDAPNLQISPHVSSLGIEYVARALDVLKVNLSRLENGEPLINQYRRSRGY